MVEWLADYLLGTPLYYTESDDTKGKTYTFYPSGGTLSVPDSKPAALNPISPAPKHSAHALPAVAAPKPATDSDASSGDAKAGSKVPTAVKWTEIPTIKITADNCSKDTTQTLTDLKVTDMTKQKMSIVGYGAQAVGSAVAHWTGGVLDSLGGIHVTAIVIGAKLSLGDNKTLGILAKTAVETAARRIAEDTLVRSLESADLSAMSSDMVNIFLCDGS
jgi:hypothetical protein